MKGARTGGKLIGEIAAEERAFYDAQTVTTRCSFCDWAFVGTAADGRAAALEHRSRHGLGDVKTVGRNGHDRQQALKLAERRRDDAAKGDRRTRGRARKWTRETMIAAAVAWQEQHGQAPRADEAKGSGGRLPQFVTARAEFGGWVAYVEAAGLVPARRKRLAGGPSGDAAGSAAAGRSKALAPAPVSEPSPAGEPSSELRVLALAFVRAGREFLDRLEQELAA